MKSTKSELSDNNLVEFQYDLYSCFENKKTCCYILFCASCATADFFTLMDCLPNKECQWFLVAITTWILVVGSMCADIFLYPGSWIVGAVVNWVCMYVLMMVAHKIAEKLHYKKQKFGCCCFLEYVGCSACKMCQIANQLHIDENGNQTPEAVELITQINDPSPCKNCLTRIFSKNSVEAEVGEASKI